MNDLWYDYSAFSIITPQSCYDGSSEKFVDPDVQKVLSKMDHPSVRVDIRATFSGVLTNLRVYPASDMQATVSTWTDHYKKPVLPRHPEKEDADEPVGRVQSAKYVALKAGDSLNYDYRSPEPYGGIGSGYTELSSVVSGHDNVLKVLDGRWSTTSVGFKVRSALCSVCGSDWMQSVCEHVPGGTYEVSVDAAGKKKKKAKVVAYLIVAPRMYDHIAFVNTPAAALSGITGIKMSDALADREVEVHKGAHVSNFVLMDSDGSTAYTFFDKDAKELETPVVKSFISLPSSTASSGDSSPESSMEDSETMADESKTLLEKVKDELIAHLGDGAEGLDETAQLVIDFISKDSDEDELMDQFKDTEFDEDNVADLVGDFLDSFHYVTEDAKEKKPQDRPGGSNAGKYSKDEGPFCGPSGGAPEGTYPIGSKKRAKSALKLAHNAPKPDGIKKCVYRHYPDLKPDNKKGDSDTEYSWSDVGISQDFEGLDEPNEKGEFVTAFGDSEKLDIFSVEEKKDELPHPDAVPSQDERKKVDSLDFAGPNRTFLASTKEQVENSYFMLDSQKDQMEEDVVSRIKACLDRRAELYGATAPSDSSEGEEDDGDTDASGNADVEDGSEQIVVATLTDRIKGLNKKVDNLHDALSDRESEVKRLRMQSLSDRRAQKTLLVDRLIDLNLSLKKRLTADCKTDEDLKDLRDKLSTRSTDSLLDSISDLRGELMGKVDSAVDPDQGMSTMDRDTPGKGQPDVRAPRSKEDGDENKPAIIVNTKQNAKSKFRGNG